MLPGDKELGVQDGFCWQHRLGAAELPDFPQNLNILGLFSQTCSRLAHTKGILKQRWQSGEITLSWGLKVWARDVGEQLCGTWHRSSTQEHLGSSRDRRSQGCCLCVTALCGFLPYHMCHPTISPNTTYCQPCNSLNQSYICKASRRWSQTNHCVLWGAQGSWKQYFSNDGIKAPGTAACPGLQHPLDCAISSDFTFSWVFFIISSNDKGDGRSTHIHLYFHFPLLLHWRNCIDFNPLRNTDNPLKPKYWS